MPDMTTEEYKAFVDAVRTGKLGTIQADGRPHVVPIWYIRDADDLVFMTYFKSMKGKNIQRDPRATLCMDDEKPPFAFVMIEGEVEIMDVTPEERLKWATVIGGRYMGADRAEEYGQRNGVEGELVLRLRPTKIIAEKGVAD